MDEITYIFEDQCIHKKIEFDVDIPKPVLAQTFCSDIGRIKQILMNLISNSFKFTSEGSIRVSAKLILQRNEGGENFRNLVLGVEDTGVGSANAEIKNLFRMFGMINKHQNKLNSKGTGLGLTISKKLTESLGGHIELESVEGKGTKIKFNVVEKPNHQGNVSLCFLIFIFIANFEDEPNQPRLQLSIPEERDLEGVVKCIEFHTSSRCK